MRNLPAQEIYRHQQEAERLEKLRKCDALAGFCFAGRRNSKGKMFIRAILFVWKFVQDLAAVSRMTPVK